MSPTEKAVPKFSSFKPKQYPAAETKRELNVEHRFANDSSENRRHKSHHEHAHTHERYKRRRSRSRERSKKSRRLDDKKHNARETRSPENTLPPVARTTAARDAWDKEQSYFVDMRGDSDNLKYGGLYKRNIPSYRRAGLGSVLGLEIHERIDSALSDDHKIFIRNSRYPSHSERPLLSRSQRAQSGEVQLVRNAGKDTVSTNLQFIDDETDKVRLSRFKV